jgi:hypothetical protein
MPDTDAIPFVDLIKVLRIADLGWPNHCTDFSSEAVAAARWNGYLDDEARLTDKGHGLLARFGFLCREVA